MEQRRSARLSLFQVGTGSEMQHLWAFRKTLSQSIPGLVIDISTEGAQVLTSRKEALQEINYHLVIHTEAEQAALIIKAHCCWSRPNSALYSSSGLVFSEKPNFQPIIAALETGESGLRCELLPVSLATNVRIHQEIERINAA